MAMVPCATVLALCLALLLACLAHGECPVLVFISLLAGAEPHGSGWVPGDGGSGWSRSLDAFAGCSDQRFGAGLSAHRLPFTAGWEPKGSARGTSLACPHWCDHEGTRSLGTQCWAACLPTGSSCRGNLRGKGGRCYQGGFSARSQHGDQAGGVKTSGFTQADEQNRKAESKQSWWQTAGDGGCKYSSVLGAEKN